jgi:hypothetical protein
MGRGGGTNGRAGLSICALLTVAIGLVGAGCSAPATGPARVPRSELPAEYRELLEAYDQGGAAWEQARTAALGDPHRTRFLVDNLTATMVRHFEQARVGSHRTTEFPFERAQRELVRLGEPAAELMVGLVAGEDDVLAHLGASTLVRMGDLGLGPSLTLLEHRRPEVRRRAAELLGELPAAGRAEVDAVASLAHVALGDPEWLVRAQAVRALGRRLPYQPRNGAILQALLTASEDGDRAVAREAAAALGQAGDVRAASALVRALERSLAEGDLELGRTAQSSLALLAGDERRRDLAAWQDFARRAGQAPRRE